MCCRERFGSFTYAAPRTPYTLHQNNEPQLSHGSSSSTVGVVSPSSSSASKLSRSSCKKLLSAKHLSSSVASVGTSSTSHPTVKLVMKLSSSSSSTNKQPSIVLKTASAVKQRYSGIISTRRGTAAAAAAATSKSAAAAAPANGKSSVANTLVVTGGHSGKVTADCVVNIERYGSGSGGSSNNNNSASSAAVAYDGVVVMESGTPAPADSCEQLLANSSTETRELLANRSTESNELLANRNTESSEMPANGSTETVELLTNSSTETSELLANRSTESNELLANRKTEPSDLPAIGSTESSELLTNRSTETSELPASRNKVSSEVLANNNTENSESSELLANRSTDRKQSANESTDHSERAQTRPTAEQHGNTVCTAVDDYMSVADGTANSADTAQTDSARMKPTSTQPSHPPWVGAMSASEVIVAASQSQNHAITDSDVEKESEDKLLCPAVDTDDYLPVAAHDNEVSDATSNCNSSPRAPFTSMDYGAVTVVPGEMNTEDLARHDDESLIAPSTGMDCGAVAVVSSETNADSAKHDDRRLMGTTVERSNMLSAADVTETVISSDISTTSSHILGSVSVTNAVSQSGAECTSGDIRETEKESEGVANEAVVGVRQSVMTETENSVSKCVVTEADSVSLEQPMSSQSHSASDGISHDSADTAGSNSVVLLLL